VREVVDAGCRSGELDLMAEHPDLNTTLASALLAPTRIYVKPILNLIRDFTIKGMAHITGGGFDGNVPRVLPKTVRARIDPGAWPRPPVFGWLQRKGEISDGEMLRVFNCGIGMVLVVPPEEADDIVERATGLGERVYRIGSIEAKAPDDPPLRFSANPSDPA
jgi:phosphoribosylformylglycinamidine cyclo-ligase